MISIVSKSQLAHHHGRSPEKAARTLGTTKTANKLRNDDLHGPPELLSIDGETPPIVIFGNSGITGAASAKKR